MLILEDKRLLMLASGMGLSRWYSGKEYACQCRRRRFSPWVSKIPWRRKWQPTPVSCLGNPMDRGVWWSAVHGITKSQTHTHTYTHPSKKSRESWHFCSLKNYFYIFLTKCLHQAQIPSAFQVLTHLLLIAVKRQICLVFSFYK